MAEYINRQALLRFLNDIWLTATPNDFMPDDDRHLAMVRCMGLNDAMDAVKSIPAADVRPVVRGKWLNDFCGKGRFSKRIVQCSLCGNFLDLDGVNAGRGDANYCPNCGADMREQPKEE